MPFLNSVEIEGFVQTDSTEPLQHQFQCQYADDTFYRESNCQVNFNPIHNGETVLVNYLQVGTIITAEDLNEIKAHLENDAIHNNYTLPTASPLEKGGVRPGDGLTMIGDSITPNLGNGLKLSNGKISASINFRGTFDSFPLDKSVGDLVFVEGHAYIFDGDIWLAF